MSSAKGVPSPPESPAQNPEPSPASKRANGFKMLILGAVLVAVNLTFFGPSAVWVCLWIAGVGFLIGGIAELAAGAKRPKP